MNSKISLPSALFIFFLFLSPTIKSQDANFTMTQIGANNFLNTPWDLHYGPEGFLWVTERANGVVVRVHPETAVKDELLKISDVYANGSQEGLLGIALHKDILTGEPYVYVSYTYFTSGKRAQKLVRYTYQNNGDDNALTSPLTIISNLPASNDHNSGRLIFGADEKLYYTIGDQGEKNCNSNLAQFLPTQQEIDSQNWSKYPGKILRLNLDGTIPDDNPIIEGVKSHIFTYGHRNPQGIILGSNGVLYSDEHGPSSDDEVNILKSGKNYGWPFVVGVIDNLVYDNDGCHDKETSFNKANYQDPLMSLFLPNTTQPSGCNNSWMCRPNIAPSSLGIYESDEIAEWKNSLLITSLKKGRIYRLKLNSDGTAVESDATQHFYTQNRYRDIVTDPDGKSFYIITDGSGKTADASGMNVVTSMKNPGAILKFTYDNALAVKDSNLESFLKIWPNPATDEFNIELNLDKDVKGELINSLGQVVQRIDKFKSGINKFKVANYPKGVYFLKLVSNTHSFQKRILLK